MDGSRGFFCHRIVTDDLSSVNYYQLLAESGNLDTIFQMPATGLLSNTRIFGLAVAHLKTSQAMEAEKYLVLMEKNKSYSYNYIIALAHAYGNNADKECYWLERSYENRDIMLTYLKVDPAFEKFRTETRVEAILQKMNYPD